MKRKLLIFSGIILIFLFFTNPTSIEFVNYGKVEYNMGFDGGKIHDFFVCSVFYGQRYSYTRTGKSLIGNKEKYLGIAGMFFKL